MHQIYLAFVTLYMGLAIFVQDTENGETALVQNVRRLLGRCVTCGRKFAPSPATKAGRRGVCFDCRWEHRERSWHREEATSLKHPEYGEFNELCQCGVWFEPSAIKPWHCELHYAFEDALAAWEDRQLNDGR